MTDAAPLTPTARAAQAYLLLLPVGHLVVVPVAGAMATGADLMLGVLVAAWLVRSAVGRRGAPGALGPPGRRYRMGILLLMAFGGWVALSALWSAYPAYAAAKGGATLALALGALALATCGLGWRRAADAWLVGTGLALVATVALWVVGLTGVVWAQERVAMGGTGITGLPFPRISGPFLHPNMFGDYLVVSVALLWGRWPELGGRAGEGGRTAPRWLASSLAVALACAMVLTASTAWVGAGVAVAWLGWRGARGRVPGVAWAPALSGTLALVGAGVAVGVTFLLVVPVEFSGFDRDLATGAMRPGIWVESVRAFATSPLAGVGAAPWLASAADPLAGGAVGSYDAHNAFLSVLAQFGMVGAALAGVGVWGMASAGWGVGRGRHGKAALRLALVAVAVNALFLASEDLRHVWALVGVVGVAAEERGR
jgi:hypothetical protein